MRPLDVDISRIRASLDEHHLQLDQTPEWLLRFRLRLFGHIGYLAHLGVAPPGPALATRRLIVRYSAEGCERCRPGQNGAESQCRLGPHERAKRGEYVSYQDEWSAIAARISGLERAEAIRASNKDAESFGATAYIVRECAGVAQVLEIFGRLHEAMLPPAANEALSRCLVSRAIQNARGHPVDHIAGSAPEAVAVLSVFAGEMTYALADRQELLRSRATRAFLHLQQVLVASAAARNEWRQAFEAGGEIACEKLGGAHLLQHGIYGFKAKTAGAETDLVFGEPLDLGEVTRASDGLVVSEWKVAGGEAAAQQKFDEAFAQLQLYPETALAGLMLRAYRFMVVVTEKRLPRTQVEGSRREKNGVVYVPVNIAFDPGNVSSQAKVDAQGAKKAGAKG